MLARSKPGELSWSAGPSLPHFVFAATLKRHHLAMVQIHRDTTTLQADLTEGRVHVLSHSLQAVSDLVDAGKARILAVTSLNASPAARRADGRGGRLSEMEIEGLSGLFGWRGMPPELRDRIAADMRAVAPIRFCRCGSKRAASACSRYPGRVCRSDRPATHPYPADHAHRRSEERHEIGMRECNRVAGCLTAAMPAAPRGRRRSAAGCR